MILESEWKSKETVKTNPDVDSDFQKLVQARANIRVWVSTSHNTEMVQEHFNNCLAAIDAYEDSHKGDTYLFVINDWSKQDTLIETHIVS